MFVFWLTLSLMKTLLFFCRKQSEEDSGIATIPQVTAIVAYSKGFACACGPGTVHLYEKTDDKDLFKKSKQIKVCQFSKLYISI